MYYRVLGVTARIGRTILPEDDQPAAPPVAVISSKYWHTRFGTDPAVQPIHRECPGVAEVTTRVSSAVSRSPCRALAIHHTTGQTHGLPIGGCSQSTGVTVALGARGLLYSHDGRRVAATLIERTMVGPSAIAIYPLDGGAPQPVVGLHPDEAVIQFTEDDQHLLVFSRVRLPARIPRLDHRTGPRSFTIS